ncbi:MAG: PorT family protein [Chitinophagaceae bacterium]|nr:PorT family protein [Chitinophagaceae bacterium]
MLRKILLSCFLVASVGLLHAQVRFGVKGGLNLNQPYSGDNDKTPPSGIPPFGWPTDQFDQKLTWHAGLTADIPVAKNLHIRPDLIFSRKIAELKKEENSPTSQMKYIERLKADYLELPVQFVYYQQKKNIAWYAGGGPYFGLGISGKARKDYFFKSGDGLNMQIESNTAREDDWYQQFQVGAVLAVGIELPFGLMGELSARHGFNDASKSKLVDNVNKIYQFSYGFSMGYLLNRRK